MIQPVNNVEQVNLDSGRLYQVNLPGEIHRFPSVTTVLKVLDKPYLEAWKMKLMDEHVRRNIPNRGMVDVARVRALLSEGKEQHKHVSGAACDFGTTVHLAIEHRMLHGSLPESVKEAPEKIQNLLREFCMWFDSEGLDPVTVEAPVYSLNFGFAGTVDLVARRPEGDLILIDHKTSNSMQPEYKLQVVAYKAAWQQVYKERITDCCVAHMNKKTGEFYVHWVPECDQAELFDVWKSMLHVSDWHRKNKS